MSLPIQRNSGGTCGGVGRGEGYIGERDIVDQRGRKEKRRGKEGTVKHGKRF